MSQLKKSLKLWDVVAICVGAMFSSGFFLLPGLAFAHTGPSVFLAYILSGFLIVPSMLSQAELSTAMPKAGGTYFFLDPAFGPVIGTIGGLGTFLGLLLKTAFALVGFGAYLQLYVNSPIKLVAALVAGVFILLNLVGAKESGRFQKLLVKLLMIAMAFFILEGLRTIIFSETHIIKTQFENFFAGGLSEFFYTIAFVFVSYAGLTKIASVAEEIENPDRNIPLGMVISVIIAIVIYGLGIFVVVGLVPGAELMRDLKPIATAEQYAFHWLPGSFGVVLVAAAALSAFASTGNAGILASSRYPLAMAKDKLIPTGLAKLNRKGVPVRSILFTGGLIILIIFALSEEGIAKFASAFQLLLFIFINIAVIVMRESRITTYDPGYKSPFYPWLQIFGVVVSFGLLIYMGTTVLAVMLMAIFLFFCWYYFYAAKRVVRRGAILHWFSRLGEGQFDFLETELWEIMKHKGVRRDDPIIEVVSNAQIITLKGSQKYEDIVQLAANFFATQMHASEESLKKGFLQKSQLGAVPVVEGLCMTGLRLVGIKDIKLLVIRCPSKFSVKFEDVHGDLFEQNEGSLALFLVSPEALANTHLRLKANWITQAETESLVLKIMIAKTEEEMRNLLYLSVHERLVELNARQGERLWFGKLVKDLPIPENTVVVNLIRDGKPIIPDETTVVRENDKLILIDLNKTE
jgi:APA family basic amino acid/polyamine antiporter